MAELGVECHSERAASKTRLLRLADWLPSLHHVRPLIAGELVSIVGDTGTSKPYVLQHIAYHCNVPTLLFELELPVSLTFERFIGVGRQMPGYDVYQCYESGKRLDYSDINHVYTCTKARISPQEMESIILKSELRMGVRPALVMVDYIQLVRGVGTSRYDRVSDAVEELKVIAKNTGTVVIMASQGTRDKES